MPELPEVETVKETLKRKVLNKKIKDVKVIYSPIVENVSSSYFCSKLKGEVIRDIKRRGKWLIFCLDNYYLLSHLRMEGKYFLRDESYPLNKHEHVVFIFDDKSELRYQDTRKFGRMHLIKKDELMDSKIMKELGYEPWDKNLTPEYLLDSYKNKKLPIKSVILDQSIIVGIGNIYADEILFLSKLNPLKRSCDLTRSDCSKIIENTKITLDKAIKEGGTTIRSYTSDEGITGRFQNSLYVHGREGNACLECESKIIKIKVGGRGTYYCPKCQKDS